MTQTPKPDAAGADLVLATQQLADNVDKLAERLTVVDEQARVAGDTAEKLAATVVVVQEQAKEARITARRSRILTRWAAALSVLAILAGGLALKALDTVQHAQVANCQNANKTRHSQRDLWSFMFDATFAQNQKLPASQKRFLQDFEAWVMEVFADRDCSDLNREYRTPTRPVIPAPAS